MPTRLSGGHDGAARRSGKQLGCVGIGGARAMILMSLMSALIACEASSSDPWDRFFEDPDAESSSEFVSNLDGSRCGWGEAANTDIVPDRVRGPLFDLIGSGNVSAFLVGLSTVRCFDGGDLLDFHQSSGRFMEQHPREFAKVTERKIASEEIVEMVTSVAVYDDVEARLGIVAKRLHLLRGLNDEESSNARSESIRALEGYLQDLRELEESPESEL
jgi:hypothetical protein